MPGQVAANTGPDLRGTWSDGPSSDGLHVVEAVLDLLAELRRQPLDLRLCLGMVSMFRQGV